MSTYRNVVMRIRRYLFDINAVIGAVMSKT